MALLESMINNRGQLGEYINYHHVLSYGFRHNFLVGARGKGKTYGLTRWLLNKCIREGKKFIWVRNSGETLNELVDNGGSKFLADHLEILGYDPNMVEFSKRLFKYEGGLVGTFMSLAAFAKIKGSNFDDHTYFIFDEFMPELGEVIRVDYEYALKSIMQSVFRERTDFVAFYTANVLRTNSNILDFFSFNILPHFEGQTIQRNKSKSAIMFYFQNQEDSSTKNKHGDPFAMANKYTQDSLILDYKNNIDPEVNKGIKKSQLLMYVVSDKNYFLLREYKGKIAVMTVKGIAPQYGLPVYAFNKKYVFGDVIFNLEVKNNVLSMWNNSLLIFRSEYILLQFTNSLFLQ